MENAKRPVTLMIGWIMLLILGILIAVGGLGSLTFAYRSGDDAPAGVSMQELAKINPELPVALRGRRATAATLAVTIGILILWIAAVPYRRGEKWSWWALLSSIGLGAVLSIFRITFLGTRLGVGPAVFFLCWAIVALAISYRDMR